MASGYGLTGGQSQPKELSLRTPIADGTSPGPGRCFPYFQELLACYVINGDSENPRQRAKCMPALEDYYECLDHRKEVLCWRDPFAVFGEADNHQKAKIAYLQKLYRERMAQQEEGFSRPTEGQLRGLGLINHEEDTKAVLSKTDDIWARAKAAANKER